MNNNNCLPEWALMWPETRLQLTCVRTLHAPCVRPRMYIDRIYSCGLLTATPCRTIPWKSMKLTHQNVLYVLSHAKYRSSNTSEIDSNDGLIIRYNHTSTCMALSPWLILWFNILLCQSYHPEFLAVYSRWIWPVGTKITVTVHVHLHVYKIKGQESNNLQLLFHWYNTFSQVLTWTPPFTQAR